MASKAKVGGDGDGKGSRFVLDDIAGITIGGLSIDDYLAKRAKSGGDAKSAKSEKSEGTKGSGGES